MKKILLLLSLICVVFIVVQIWAYKKPNVAIRLGGKDYTYEIFDTPEKRQLGLSNRETIAENHAVLFVFEENGYHGFWMKDMQFPIDIIWFDENFTTVDWVDSATPESYPTTFYPKDRAKYVVETKTGERIKQNIDIGTKLYYK